MDVVTIPPLKVSSSGPCCEKEEKKCSGKKREEK
jgi:hypothetical protein